MIRHLPMEITLMNDDVKPSVIDDTIGMVYL